MKIINSLSQVLEISQEGLFFQLSEAIFSWTTSSSKP